MSMTVAHAKLNKQRIAWSIDTHRGSYAHIAFMGQRKKEGKERSSANMINPALVAV